MGFRRGPNIVRDGLIFSIDTAAERSYSSLSYNDLSPTGTTATATANCIFVNEFQGGLKCDNAPSGFVYSNNLAATNYVTIEVAYKLWGSNYTTDGIVFNKEGCWEMRDLNGNLQWALKANNQGWFWHDTGYDVAIGETLIVALMYDGGQVQVYINGSLYQTYNYPDGGVLADQTTAYPKFNSRGTNKTTFENGGEHTLYNYRIYNRALSATEIAQNFNALKGRFGL